MGIEPKMFPKKVTCVRPLCSLAASKSFYFSYFIVFQSKLGVFFVQWLGCFEDFFMKNALLLSQYIYNQQIQKTNTIDQLYKYDILSYNSLSNVNSLLDIIVIYIIIFYSIIYRSAKLGRS